MTTNASADGGDPLEVKALVERARSGDAAALAELFERYRPRLQRMVEARLDRRLRGRVDASDVLQDTFLNLARKLDAYARRDDLPFFLWLRLVTGECLVDLHRRHLFTARRDAALEVSLYQGPMPQTDSYSVAALLLGKITTASQKLMRAEAQVELQAAINAMDPIDREVVVLRHFEELSSQETAQILGIGVAAAGMRYFRALRRLKEVLEPKS